MKKIFNFIITISLLVSLLTLLTGCIEKENKNGNYKIVTSFYPIYIMTLNITDGAQNIELSNMADVNVGCVHNYTLQTEDLKKLSNADVLVQNGLDIENFMDKVTSAYSDLKIVNSTEEITDYIKDDDETNGHTWTSIANYIKQVEKIKNSLTELNNQNSNIYEKNANEYIKKLNSLNNKYNKELSMLNGKKVVSLNESFAYLQKDLELDVLEVHTDHEESTLSAEKLKSIIEKMKAENINIIIIDKDDNEKNANTLANETGAKIYKLNSCLKGEMNKDSYINAMNENLEVLKSMI